MSFPRYEKYKDSDVKWLGKIPKDWDIYSLKRAVEGCVNGIWGSEPSGVDDIPVIRVADFERENARVGLGKLTYRNIAHKDRQSRSLQSGDLLIEKSGGGEKTLVGCVVLFKHNFEAVTSNFVARLRPYSRFNSGFLCYVFSSLYEGKVNLPSIKQTTGIQNLDSGAYLQEYFCFPSSHEQKQISRFLDYETERIDALIAEQERLIALLKEKRQAVISHAVTKGCDRTVPMKDSGVEWLGEVPEHWKIAKVKYVVQKFEQGWSPQCENVPVDDELQWGVLKVGCVNGGSFSAEENKKLPESLEPLPELSLKSGDILISRANTRELVGSSALVDLDYSNLMISDKLFRLRTTNRTLPRYLVLYLGTNSVRYQIELEATGASSSMLNIGQSVIKELYIPVPPLIEQHDITDRLNSSLSTLRRLRHEAKATQSLLQERRSALISAAVTGKIDVRNWQPPISTASTPTLEAIHH